LTNRRYVAINVQLSYKLLPNQRQLVIS